tara:strand:- start:428 stop:550 length:123 start_codon:yes stop_codon:yes gene_type:complete
VEEVEVHLLVHLIIPVPQEVQAVVELLKVMALGVLEIHLL